MTVSPVHALNGTTRYVVLRVALDLVEEGAFARLRTPLATLNENFIGPFRSHRDYEPVLRPCPYLAANMSALTTYKSSLGDQGPLTSTQFKSAGRQYSGRRGIVVLELESILRYAELVLEV